MPPRPRRTVLAGRAPGRVPPVLYRPTFQTFIGLVVGLIAQTRRRTVRVRWLTGAGLDQCGITAARHRVVHHARWNTGRTAIGSVLSFLPGGPTCSGWRRGPSAVHAR